MSLHRSITAEATAHRQADLLARVNQPLCSSRVDAPDVLAKALRAHLDSDLAEMLDDLMGIYRHRNTNNEEAFGHAGWLVNEASKIYDELENLQ